MSTSDKISMQTEEVLKVELEFFRQEHRDLDQAIIALSDTATSDRLMIQRLKKKKLQLKDKITLLEDRLTPDIIA
ncbi:MAG: DUF465 domain-containing protein [Paracoccaceae bacterium]|jgi:hypothetical protein|nr:DUF465 domain-containing protein [Paracoccaceae bacterium]MDG1677460.1 DUF465 domain-containing protein [Paracoccaceae bacterium]MDG2248387.1 DUF465 domain-containing protein [Paracoccaceae bacterium]